MNGTKVAQSQSDILAGPYELLHKTKIVDKVTLCITSNNELSQRYYNGPTVVSTDLTPCKDFDNAMEQLQSKIAEFKKEKYTVKGENELKRKAEVPVQKLDKKVSK